MVEEVMMVPSKDFERLVQYYKGEITDNALLNKAARLAAESHLLLKDNSVPDGIATARLRPIAHERARLTKRIRQFPAGGRSVDPLDEEREEEDDGLVTGPLYNMMKQIIKGSAKKSTPLVTPKRRTTPVVEEVRSVRKKSQTEPTPKRKTSSERLKEIRERSAAIRKEVVNKIEKLRKRKTEAEKLKPLSGWEDWAKGKKLRRQLEYDEDEED